MTVPPRYRLSETEKDALLVEQATLIERLAARVAELEALLGKPKKTSANSHSPPSQDGLGRKAGKPKRPRKPRPSRCRAAARPRARSHGAPSGRGMPALPSDAVVGDAALPAPLRPHRPARGPSGGDAGRAVRRPLRTVRAALSGRSARRHAA